MLSIEQARQVIAENLHLLPAERVELRAARSRVLRAPLVAEHDLPPFDRSTFDGYAVRAAETPARLRLAGSVAAGQMPASALGETESSRIFTGAPLPKGADAVAMQESCKVEGELVEVPAMRPGDGVRYRGEDARAGSVLVSSGTRLGAVELSLMAQMGHTQPLVAPRCRVFHVRTGDEIVSPECEPGPGQIRDSNSTLIAGLVGEVGAELTGHATAADRLDALMESCQQGEGADILLISGGASVGDFDFGRAALTELGYSVRFAGINLRPGKPLIFATRGRQAAFVIPGNPLSHFVCWHVVIRAAVDLMMTGAAGLNLSEILLGGAAPVVGNPRETWWPARLDFQGGNAVVVPLKWQSSGDMTAMAGVDALIRVPSASMKIDPGQVVHVMRL